MNEQILVWTDEKDLSKRQTYEEHVNGMIECWNKYLKKKYAKSLTRVLRVNSSLLDEIVKFTLILHDAGKCTLYYQQNITSPKRYRHEIVSAYLAYRLSEDVFEKRIRHVISGSIFIHHEPILMGSISFQRERGVTLTDIRGRIEYPSSSRLEKVESTKIMHNNFKSLLESLLINHLNSNTIDKMLDNLRSIKTELSVDDIVNTIGNIVSTLALAGDDTWRHMARIQVSALQYILVVCDYYGSKNRDSEESKFQEEIKWEWGEET
ncbi:CRISPR-associated HD domain protein [Ferroglobus placidus DSM 10642]|uniref:CRISPR-associated HD domain protein n=1 Tax=Ferroglobus placidus (strain DSM 10642 / AEDII12DO) TaxID=589924 RepID=D3RZU1_FERPA|nr:CRISPR-associated endonuclease Cas3'' [Ferroglobus placidus]ADC66004.1 CRISPR-associated HD domain protein [Ferroglobus placidus DSM 10642]